MFLDVKHILVTHSTRATRDARPTPRSSVRPSRAEG
jgi:hypothetical protein